MQPEPFALHIEQSKLDDLSERLMRIRWPDMPLETGWSYSTDLTFMKRLVSYWSTQFDWRVQEAKLNHFPQYTVEIGDVHLHYLHVPAKGGGDRRPLLLSHGWPGSVFEFMDLIPRLTDPLRLLVLLSLYLFFILFGAVPWGSNKYKGDSSFLQPRTK